METKKVFVLLLCFSVFYSCVKYEKFPVLSERTHYNFIPRQCKHIWAHNLLLDQRTLYDGSFFNDYEYMSKEDSVSFTNYVLEFSTSSTTWEDYLCYLDVEYPDYAKIFRSEKVDTLAIPLYTKMNSGYAVESPDMEIENQLSQLFNQTRARTAWVDYRITPIKDIKITSSMNIGGVKAGESLNDLLVVCDYPVNHWFIITANKQLIERFDDIMNISIDKYLSYHPMAPAALRLKFRDGVSIAEATKATFTIELTTDEGNVLKSETRAICLLP